MTSRLHRDNLGKVSAVEVKGPQILPIPVWERLCHLPTIKSTGLVGALGHWSGLDSEPAPWAPAGGGGGDSPGSGQEAHGSLGEGQQAGRTILEKSGCGSCVTQPWYKGPLRFCVGLGPQGGRGVSSRVLVALWPSPAGGPLSSSHSHMWCCGQGPS